MSYKFVPKDIVENLDPKTLEVLESAKNEKETIDKLLKIIISFNGLKSKEEIISMYNFSKRSFDDLVRANQIPHYKINNKTRLFNPIEINEYFNNHYKVKVGA